MMRVVGEGEGARGSRVYGVSFTRWPSPFIANLLNETCRAYIVRLLVPSVAYSPPIRIRLETRLSTPPTVEDGIMEIYICFTIVRRYFRTLEDSAVETGIILTRGKGIVYPVYDGKQAYVYTRLRLYRPVNWGF